MKNKINKLTLALSEQTDELNSWKTRCSYLEEKNKKLRKSKCFTKKLEEKIKFVENEIQNNENENNSKIENYKKEIEIENQRKFQFYFQEQINQNELIYKNEIEKFFNSFFFNIFNNF